VGPTVLGAVAPDEAPHDGPSQTAPDVAVPESPAVTETLCVWVTLMGPWLVVPPATTLVVWKLLATLVWAVSPVAATGLLLGTAPPIGSTATGEATVSVAVVEPDWALATPVSWMLTAELDRTLMAASLTPPTCTRARALFDTMFSDVRPVADALPDVAPICPPGPETAGALLAGTAGALLAETAGALLAEAAGALLAETAGALLAEAAGALLAETAGALLAETAGALLAETAGALLAEALPELALDLLPTVTAAEL